LRDFDGIVDAVKQMLVPGKLTGLRKNVQALNNRAVFEIPEIFGKLLS